MSQDFRLGNMDRLKAVLDAQSDANQNNLIGEDNAGKREKDKYSRLPLEQKLAYDEIERQTLADAGIATHEVPTFRFSKADWERRGGKRSRRKSRGKRRKTNKKRRSTKKRR